MCTHWETEVPQGASEGSGCRLREEVEAQPRRGWVLCRYSRGLGPNNLATHLQPFSTQRCILLLRVCVSLAVLRGKVQGALCSHCAALPDGAQTGCRHCLWPLWSFCHDPLTSDVPALHSQRGPGLAGSACRCPACCLNKTQCPAAPAGGELGE